MAQAQFALIESRGVLAVSGPDRYTFLQGLVSNDVAKVGPARARYAALLTAQGKYLHDFMMIEVGGAIWLEAEAGRLADLRRRLTIYRLRAKAVLDERASALRRSLATRLWPLPAFPPSRDWGGRSPAASFSSIRGLPPSAPAASCRA
jgi:folate-binding Fe-S cluster repair protein YgfZ